jgi:hypothetical protein
MVVALDVTTRHVAAGLDPFGHLFLLLQHPPAGADQDYAFRGPVRSGLNQRWSGALKIYFLCGNLRAT